MPAPENIAKSTVRIDCHAIHGGDLLLSGVPSSCGSSFGYEQANLFFQDDNLHTPQTILAIVGSKFESS